MRMVALVVPLVVLLAAGGARMQITSPSFTQGGAIPVRHTCDGQDVSPPLSWSGAPAGTKSFALIADDPDAPAGTWVHWVVWNLPAGAASLPENVARKDTLPGGARQGTTDFRRIGYGGPCPPSGTHRYYFRIYALDALLELPASTNRKDLEKAMQGRVLAQAEWMGTYSRKP